jgi:hypothetical protein
MPKSGQHYTRTISPPYFKASREKVPMICSKQTKFTKASWMQIIQIDKGALLCIQEFLLKLTLVCIKCSRQMGEVRTSIHVCGLVTVTTHCCFIPEHLNYWIIVRFHLEQQEDPSIHDCSWARTPLSALHNVPCPMAMWVCMPWCAKSQHWGFLCPTFFSANRMKISYGIMPMRL